MKTRKPRHGKVWSGQAKMLTLCYDKNGCLIPHSKIMELLNNEEQNYLIGLA